MFECECARTDCQKGFLKTMYKIIFYSCYLLPFEMFWQLVPAVIVLQWSSKRTVNVWVCRCKNSILSNGDFSLSVFTFLVCLRCSIQEEPAFCGFFSCFERNNEYFWLCLAYGCVCQREGDICSLKAMRFLCLTSLKHELVYMSAVVILIYFSFLFVCFIVHFVKFLTCNFSYFSSLKMRPTYLFLFFIAWAQIVLSAVVFLYSDSGIIANSELKKYCIFFPLASLFFSIKCSLNWNAYLSFSRETKVLTHHQITQMYCTLNV